MADRIEASSLLIVRADGKLCISAGMGTQFALDPQPEGNLSIGGNGVRGVVRVYSKAGDSDPRFEQGKGMHIDSPAIRLDGETADIWAGGAGADANLVLQTAQGASTVRIAAKSADIWLGGSGTSGDIVLLPKDADESAGISEAKIRLNGETGDILLSNADCAEDFDVAEADDAEPGTVLVIESEGRLRPSTQAYDTRVAGVVSGAGECQPGIVLDRNPDLKGRRPVALVGKVFCKVDATERPIAVGNLLTTSSTPGHAMRASDPERAFGAVLGKALAEHPKGRGVIPVLVTLQ